ncbi:MAG: hypothetical protein WC614_03800 [bacterium]
MKLKIIILIYILSINVVFGETLLPDSIRKNKMVKFDINKKIKIDLNGDKKKENIMVSFHRETGDTIIININNKTAINYSSDILNYFYIVDIDSTDKFLDIAIEDDGPSDDPITTFYRYTDSIIKLGRIPGNSQHRLSREVFTLGGDGFIKTKGRGRVLSTWYYDAKYAFSNQKNKILQVDTEFVTMNQNVVLLCDLPLYTAINDTTIKTILKSGSPSRIAITDNKEWFKIEDGQGNSGWFRVERYSTVKNVKKHSSSVFKGLCFED